MSHRPHSGSLLRRLQVSFALATLAVVGLLAIFMDQALRHSFEAEDAMVMEAQADGMQPRRAGLGRHAGNYARVDACGKEHANGDIC